MPETEDKQKNTNGKKKKITIQIESLLTLIGVSSTFFKCIGKIHRYTFY